MPGCEMAEEETLDYDPTAYDCLTSLSLDWPCLSFDIVGDALGDNRVEFPHSLSLVAGTQAAPGKHNYLAVMRVTNLTQGRHGQKTQKDKQDSDDDVEMVGDSDEEDDAEDAVLTVRKFAHRGVVNRVRCMPQLGSVIATWSETGQVQVWDTKSLHQDMMQGEAGADHADAKKVQKMQAMQVYVHSAEGYALDWSPCVAGRLASGDCKSKIYLWEPGEAGKWSISGPIKGHTESVEDLQWAPGEPTVFASASVDKTVRIWDTRAPNAAQIVFQAHDTDVNVISWNRETQYMLASGGDDGHLRVWDMRNLQQTSPAQPVANFTSHRGPITSVEWAPFEASMIQTTSADDTLAVWDLAVERDPEEEAALAVGVAAPEDLPPQLMFIHAGQTDMKEVCTLKSSMICAPWSSDSRTYVCSLPRQSLGPLASTGSRIARVDSAGLQYPQAGQRAVDRSFNCKTCRPNDSSDATSTILTLHEGHATVHSTRQKGWSRRIFGTSWRIHGVSSRLEVTYATRAMASSWSRGPWSAFKFGR
jgi:ribosome assembly protein RRB1